MRIKLAALGAAVAVLATACIGSDDESRTFTADFTRAVQVFPGVKVKVLGVDVGQITEVANVDGAVRVTFRIDDPNVKIPSDVRATLVPISLLGERYMQLFPTYTGGSQLEDGSNIALSNTSVPAEGDELLRAMQEYLGELDGDTVEEFVANAAQVLQGKGKHLNRLINYGTSVLETLSSRRNELADMVVQFDRLTQALATRQDEIGEVLRNYNVVAATINDVRSSVEGTITGLSKASASLGDLLADHRGPLGADIRTLTRTTRTLDRNINAFANTGHWATRLFKAASRAVDYERDWLRLNNQGEPLGELIAARVEDRLIGLCLRLGDADCAQEAYWEKQIPELFCADKADCAAAPKTGKKSNDDEVDKIIDDNKLEINKGLDKLDEELNKVVDKVLKKDCSEAKHPKRCRKRKRSLREDLEDAGNLDEAIDDLIDGLGGGGGGSGGGGDGGLGL